MLNPLCWYLDYWGEETPQICTPDFGGGNTTSYTDSGEHTLTAQGRTDASVTIWSQEPEPVSGGGMDSVLDFGMDEENNDTPSPTLGELLMTAFSSKAAVLFVPKGGVLMSTHRVQSVLKGHTGDFDRIGWLIA